MRLRHIKGAEQQIAESPFVIHDPEEQKGQWRDVFGNDHPIKIEVGMGKGKFIMDLAAAHPDVNYLGIERYSSVLLRALQKRAERDLSNIFFLCIDAKEMSESFTPGEVSRTILNFSDPWPKERTPKRCLTYPVFSAL